MQEYQSMHVSVIFVTALKQCLFGYVMLGQVLPQDQRKHSTDLHSGVNDVVLYQWDLGIFP